MVPLTGAVVVTTPQEVALLDVRKAVEMFKTTKVPILGVIETMSYFVCDGCDKKHEIFGSGGGRKFAEELGVKILGQIPIEASVSKGGDKGKPIVQILPGSPSAEAYTEASGQVASQLSILNISDVGNMTSFSLDWENSK